VKIVRIHTRHFVVSCDTDLHDLALKILNEWRLMGQLDPKLADVVERVCADLDGAFAWEILAGTTDDMQVIAPEPVR
jgi:hypothetical protein